MRGHRYEFTDDQIIYIIKNWGKESAHSMKKRFGCSWEAVCRVAEEHGLELPTSNKWTDEQIEQLKLLADNYHYKEIAKIMNRSENAIYLKARKLGIILIQNGRKWTKEEEEILQDEWGNRRVELIAKKMKRTVFALKVKAIRMGLGSMINNNYEIITVSDMADLLSVSRDRILRTWVKLGLNLKQKKLTSDKAYYYVIWADLMDFLKNNQNEWDSRCIDINMLGPEPDWLLEKRKRDAVENPMWYRYWTDEEKEKAIDMIKAGKSYQEIAILLNRSEWSVANLVRNSGYSYSLPQFWKGSELKYLKDNYQNMTYQEIADELGRTVRAVESKAEELGYQKHFIRTRKGSK